MARVVAWARVRVRVRVRGRVRVRVGRAHEEGERFGVQLRAQVVEGLPVRPAHILRPLALESHLIRVSVRARVRVRVRARVWVRVRVRVRDRVRVRVRGTLRRSP